MKNLLADANWLIRWEREHREGRTGAARRLVQDAKVHVNAIAACEFLSAGESPTRRRLLQTLVRLPATGYGDAHKAAQLRFARSKQGRTLSTPDAFMAAAAIMRRMQLVTADKDFSGIPGLDWAAYADQT